MKIYCINMKDAAERCAWCEEQFKREGMDVTFVRGFDGRASRLRHEQEWISKQVGVCISHISLMEEIRHSFQLDEIYLVFEDDPIIEADFMNKLLARIETLPEHWNVAAVSWFGGDKGAEMERVNDDWSTFKSGDVWGQCCYLVNGSWGANQILECITPIRSHIDRMFWECCRDGLMKGYFMNNPLVLPNWSFKSQNV